MAKSGEAIRSGRMGSPGNLKVMEQVTDLCNDLFRGDILHAEIISAAGQRLIMMYAGRTGAFEIVR